MSSFRMGIKRFLIRFIRIIIKGVSPKSVDSSSRKLRGKSIEELNTGKNKNILQKDRLYNIGTAIRK